MSPAIGEASGGTGGVGSVQNRSAIWHHMAYSSKIVRVPRLTMCDRSSASQLVSRMQPCDSVWPIRPGSGVPWIP